MKSAQQQVWQIHATGKLPQFSQPSQLFSEQQINKLQKEIQRTMPGTKPRDALSQLLRDCSRDFYSYQERTQFRRVPNELEPIGTCSISLYSGLSSLTTSRPYSTDQSMAKFTSEEWFLRINEPSHGRISLINFPPYPESKPIISCSEKDFTKLFNLDPNSFTVLNGKDTLLQLMEKQQAGSIFFVGLQRSNEPPHTIAVVKWQTGKQTQTLAIDPGLYSGYQIKSLSGLLEEFYPRITHASVYRSNKPVHSNLMNYSNQPTKKKWWF